MIETTPDIGYRIPIYFAESNRVGMGVVLEKVDRNELGCFFVIQVDNSFNVEIEEKILKHKLFYPPV